MQQQGEQWIVACRICPIPVKHTSQGGFRQKRQRVFTSAAEAHAFWNKHAASKLHRESRSAEARERRTVYRRYGETFNAFLDAMNSGDEERIAAAKAEFRRWDDRWQRARSTAPLKGLETPVAPFDASGPCPLCGSEVKGFGLCPPPDADADGPWMPVHLWPCECQVTEAQLTGIADKHVKSLVDTHPEWFR